MDATSFIPFEIKEMIIFELDAKSACNLSATCSFFRDLTQTARVWRKFIERDFGVVTDSDVVQDLRVSYMYDMCLKKGKEILEAYPEDDYLVYEIIPRLALPLFRTILFHTDRKMFAKFYYQMWEIENKIYDGMSCPFFTSCCFLTYEALLAGDEDSAVFLYMTMSINLCEVLFFADCFGFREDNIKLFWDNAFKMLACYESICDFEEEKEEEDKERITSELAGLYCHYQDKDLKRCLQKHFEGSEAKIICGQKLGEIDLVLDVNPEDKWYKLQRENIRMFLKDVLECKC